MTDRIRTIIAIGVLVCTLAYFLAPKAVDAASYPPAYKESSVTHVEHLAPRIETHPGNCVRAVFTSVADASGFLSGEPDAAAGYPFAGPDAAIWQSGGDAAVWIPPDSGVMGPRVLPKSGVPYQCYTADNRVCWKQGVVPTSCVYTASFPADQNTPPFAFTPEPDGGRPMVFGVTSSGTGTTECCVVVPAIMSGN